MENNGNKPRGIVIVIVFVLLSLLLLFGILSLCLKSDLYTLGYKDPIVSENNIRGTIYDRNGKILALQAPSYGFEINNDKDKTQFISSFLSEYTDYSAMEISALIDEGSSFIPLSSSITRPSLEYYSKIIEESGLGEYIEFSNREVRRYPTHIAKEILGSSSSPSRGEGGIEELFNDYLKAEPKWGEKTVIGSSLTLTLDFQMQLLLETFFDELHLNGNAAIYSPNGYILAYVGEVTEEILLNLVRYITTPDSSIQERVIILPEDLVDAVSIGDYMFFYNGEKKETVLNGLQVILKRNGKI